MRSWQDRPTDTFTENPARFSNIQTWDSRMTTHGISKPKARRRRMLGLAQAQAAVQVRGVEVVQCVQDLTNSVPLLATKTTIVRVYLDPTSVSQTGQITGELAWSRSGGADTFLPGINSLRLNPWSPFNLQEQREDLDRSLNFRLLTRKLNEAVAQHDSATIQASFEPYYRTTILAEETDSNKLHDLKAELDRAGVYTQDTVDEFVKSYLGGVGRDKLDPLLDGCVAVY